MSCSEIGSDQDIRLVERAIIGDRKAFDELYDTHKRFIHNVCYRMLGSIDDAVDATQTTFIQAYNSLWKFRKDSSFRTWLYRIAINTSIKMLKDRQRREKIEREIDITTRNHTADDHLWAAMLKLPSDMRAVLVLFYFQQLSLKDISGILDCSEGATKVRLHRARLALRAKYEEMDNEV